MSRIYHIDTVAPVVLSGATVLTWLGTALLLVLGLWTYSSWSRLRHIPGPSSAGLSKWWMFRSSISGNMHLALKDAVDKYGKYQPKGPGRFHKHPGQSSVGRRPVPGAWEPMVAPVSANGTRVVGEDLLTENAAQRRTSRTYWAQHSGHQRPGRLAQDVGGALAVQERAVLSGRSLQSRSRQLDIDAGRRGAPRPPLQDGSRRKSPSLQPPAVVSTSTRPLSCDPPLSLGLSFVHVFGSHLLSF